MQKRTTNRWVSIGLALATVLAIATTITPETHASGRGREPRMRTLEDLYGDTGNRFQGAIGFQNREAQAQTEAASGFGIAVDDVVLQWREFTLVEDGTDCDASGACATINLQANNIFAGRTILTVEVVDATPAPANDCDLDGTVDGTRDCDGNGVDDVVVKINSVQEVAGEIVVLNRVSSSFYRGTLALSSSYDLPGVIFVAAEGATNPTVTALYMDTDDGTGSPCQNNVDPTSWGRVQTTSTVLLTAGEVQVTRTILDDNGDGDGWADDFETIRMRIEVSNKTGMNLTGLTLRATSNDPAIACITRPYLEVGDLAAGETRYSEAELEFTMGEIGRTDAFAEMTAKLNIAMDADQFQSPLRPQSVTFDLDLDASGGAGPTTYFEGFEGSDYGSFVPMPIDNDLNPPDDDLGNIVAGVLNADGFRCQYSDPDWENSVSFGSSQAPVCFPSPNNTPDNFWFQISANRAFSGVQSLYWGTLLDPALGFSHPTANIEAVRTEHPLALAWGSVCEVDRTIACSSAADCPGSPQQECVPAQPLLTFKHQISFMDHRTVNAQPGRGNTEGVVMAQLADETGAPQGDWIKLVPYVNTYDSKANSNYFNCSFDPTDDGNTEDDFFDPNDPARDHGPSSTCSPEFSFMDQGQTGLRFDSRLIGDALDGPGLEGAKGIGTWVEPRVDLSRFRGRSLRLRFLVTGFKLGSTLHWEQIFVFNPDPRDDGWWVDDVTVTDALNTPADVGPDLKDNSGLPSCDVACQSVTAFAQASPPATSVPGQVTELDAGASAVPRCVNGVPQYRFVQDSDRDGAVDPEVDLVLRDWTDDPTLLVTPQGSVRYLVGVRCGTETECADDTIVEVDVTCPIGSAGLAGGSSRSTAFLYRDPAPGRHILFPTIDRLTWGSAATVDVIRGDLSTLRSGLGFVDSGAVTDCLLDNAMNASAVTDTNVPPLGKAWFYLARSAEHCNAKAGGSWGQVGEAEGRDVGIVNDPDACGE